MTRVLALSPHYDDIPLSLGQSLLDGELRRARVTVGVVFGRSNWVRYFHPTRSRWPLATAIRSAEEVRNAARFRYRLKWGRFEESILRTGITDSAEFLDPTVDVDDDPLVAPIATLIAKWAANADVVLAPLGLGGHLDHLLVAAAGRLAAETGREVAFYEDRPYACWLDDDALLQASRVAAPGRSPRPISGPITTAKRDRIWYPSQFDDFFIDAMGLDESQGRCETVWADPAAPWPATGTPTGATT